MAIKSDASEFRTLKQCLEFLYWLHTQKGVQGQLANRLMRLLERMYNSVDQNLIKAALTSFLNNVSLFYIKLCKSPQGSYSGDRRTKPALNALLECIPKVLSACYFLRYNVDEKFNKVGGGKWMGNWPGWDGPWAARGGGLQKYLTMQVGSKNSVIPGGFQSGDVKRGHGQNGYPQGFTMVGDLDKILNKHFSNHNFFLDVFVTSVLSTNSAVNASNSANALRLVQDFCGIFEDTDNEAEFKSHVQYRGNCINWTALKGHCIKLKKSLGKIFTTTTFSFTGYGREYKHFNKNNIDKRMASWLKKHLPDMKENLEEINTPSALKIGADMDKLATYFTTHFFPYGFTFHGHDFGTTNTKYKVLKESWVDVINYLKKPGDGLEQLKTILDGTLCEQEYEDEESIEEPPDENLNVEEEKPTATKTEAAKPVVTKNEATPNQGNKAEGTQNQGKKAEGGQGNATPPSSPNEPAVQIQPQTVSTSDSGSPGAPDASSGQVGSSVSGKGSSQESHTGTTTRSSTLGDALGDGETHGTEGVVRPGGKGDAPVPDSPKCKSGETIATGLNGKKMCFRNPTMPRRKKASGLYLSPDVLEVIKKADESDRQKKEEDKRQADEKIKRRRQKIRDQYQSELRQIQQEQLLAVEGSPIMTTEPWSHIILDTAKRETLPDVSAILLKKRHEADERSKNRQQIHILKDADNVNVYTINPPKNHPYIRHSQPPPKLYNPNPAVSYASQSVLIPSEMEGIVLPQNPPSKLMTPKHKFRQPHKPIQIEKLDVKPYSLLMDVDTVDLTKPSKKKVEVVSPQAITPPPLPIIASGVVVSNPKLHSPSTALISAKPSGLPSTRMDSIDTVQPDEYPMTLFSEISSSAIKSEPNTVTTVQVQDPLHVQMSSAEPIGHAISDPRDGQEAGKRMLQLQYADSELKSAYALKAQTLANEINRHTTFLEQVKKDDDQAKVVQKLLQDVKEELVTLHSNSESIDRTAVGLAALNDRYKITPVIEKGAALNLIEDGIVNKPPTAIQPEEHLKTKLILEAESKNVVRGDVHITVQAPAPSALDDNHGLSIDVPNRPLRDDSYDLDLATFYGNSGNVVIDELKNADSWYGEDKGFSGLPNSNFNLEFTPTFLESAGHDPGMPLNPSRQVSARGVALFPDPNVCTNPWYVPASSTDRPHPTTSPPPATDHLPPPKTVREMLHWFVGLNTYGLIGTIQKYVEGICKDFKSNAIEVTGGLITLTATMVTTKLTEACLYAASLLYKVKHNNDFKAFSTFDFRSEYTKFCYSSDPACLLCQLRDYAYACHHQLEFLKVQCNRDKSHGGWKSYEYGSDITASKSPLQAFLTDGWDSDFDTHLFDPCNLCLKSRIWMGFKADGLPKTLQQGSTISAILSPSCGGDDPLLTVCSYLNCLTRRTPRTTGELVSYFHNFGNELHGYASKSFSPLGNSLLNPHPDCPDWDHLGRHDLQAVKGIRGSESLMSKDNSSHDIDHPRTLSTLVGCGSDPDSCPQHCSPITYRAYAMYSQSFAHTYLSWVVYLPDRLWESLQKLHYDLQQHVGSGKCTSLHSCPDALPLLYLHGFTPPEGKSQVSVTCSDVISKLEEIVDGKPIADLMSAMDDFLYGIREPFMYALVALWSLAFLIFANTMLYRIDILHIRSHLIRTKASHVIDVKALLSDNKKMMSLYDASYFDEDPNELLNLR